jgi:rubrerythrin
MEIFHEMKKYQTSQSGNIVEMMIPLKPNDDGFVGRMCPDPRCNPKYFQIRGKKPEGFTKNQTEISDGDLTCPYCGHVDNFQKFHSEDHKKWIESMIERDIAITIQKMFEGVADSFKPASNSAFSLEMKFEPGPLPNVRYYSEEKLKRIVTCDNCNFEYAIYGISFHCPLCGKGNLNVHLTRNVEITRVLIKESEKFQTENNPDVAQRMIGNALEDVVGIFEGFLKSIYIYGVKKNFPEDEANNKIDRIRVTFQRLDGAQNLLLGDLKYDLFSEISEDDKKFLEEQFLKRHVLTHNMGLVDEKYLEKAQEYLKQGSELEILPSDVSRALDIVAVLVGKASNQIVK